MSRDFLDQQEAAQTQSVAIIGTRGYPSYYGGFETAVRKLAPYLCDSGWDVTVYGRPGAVKEGDPSHDRRVTVLKTFGIESKSLSTLSYGLTSVLSALVKRPDVVLVMNVANGYWLPLLRLRNIPTVVNVDGMEWERAKWGKVAKSVFKFGAKLTARYGTTLITDAKEIQRRWRKDFGRDSLFIPYGGETPEDLPLEDGLTHRGYVLLVARFVPENTVAEFFKAVETIAVEHPVVLVGATGYGGELDDRAAALASTLSNVRWLGHVKDDVRLFSLFQHAGAYFHGHSVGGTNPALVQAMACGAPIVARDTVYNREVLADTALFCNPDPRSIAQSVEDLMKDKDASTALGDRARIRAEEDYSWRDVCLAYSSALEQTLSTVLSASNR